MKYIAHRGLSKVHKDNSIEAIGEALSQNYYGVEIDVQLCKSGEIVLYHDVYTSCGFIDELELIDLKKMGICSLKDVYDQLPRIRDIVIIIDIKGYDKNVTNALNKFYEKEDTSKIYFSSFNRKLTNQLSIRFNIGTTFETTYLRAEYDFITKGLTCVIIHWTCLDNEFIAFCKNKNIKVLTYTHKEPRELEYMLRYDVDGIITNG